MRSWLRRLPDPRDVRPAAVIVLLAGLALNLAVLFLVNHPLAAALRARDAQVRALRDRLEARRAEVASLEESRAWAESQARAVGIFFDQVLSGKGERMVAVQREIREIARRNGIDPRNIGYSDLPVEGTRDMVRFSAAFPLTGSYGSLRSFLRDVENARNFLIVDSIELRNSKEGGVNLSLLVQVSTIFRDPDYRLLRGE